MELSGFLRKMIIFLMLSFSCLLIASDEHHINPSFDCKRASTEIETIICKSEEISRLDNILSWVYKNSLKMVDDPKVLCEEQKEWLKKRPTEALALERYYEARFEQLLQNEKVLSYCVEDMLTKPSRANEEELNAHRNSYIFSVLTKNLVQKKSMKEEDIATADLPSDRALFSLFPVIDKKKYIIFNCSSRGAYQANYEIYMLERKEPNHFMVTPIPIPFYDREKKEIALGDSFLGNYTFKDNTLGIGRLGNSVGQYTVDQEYELRQDKLTLISQKATKDFYDPNFEPKQDMSEDELWVKEYPK